MNNSKKNVKLMFIEGNTEHRILRINPQILKFAAWLVPIGTVTLLIIFGALSLFLYNKISNIQFSSTVHDKNLAEQLVSNEKIIEDLNNQIQVLNNKILTPAENAGSLQLFTTTQGFKDLSSQTLVNVENFNFSIIANALDIKFELHNQSGLERITGYFFVLTYTPEQLIFYPTFNTIQTELNFSQGETFNIGRFKNVIFNLPLSPSAQKGKIQMRIVAFSRTGDLLLNKSFEIK